MSLRTLFATAAIFCAATAALPAGAQAPNFGIKPLLYTLTPERFVFASEHRALVRSGLIQTSIDADVARRLMLDAFSVEGSERQSLQLAPRLIELIAALMQCDALCRDAKPHGLVRRRFRQARL